MLNEKKELSAMARVEEATQLLMRLIAGDDPEIVRQESQELLAAIEPQDIALAEQKLLELGIGISDFQGLCAAHMEAFKDQKSKIITTLPQGHVLNRVLSEHEMIICFVSELEDINKEVQQLDHYATDTAQIKKLAHVARYFVLADERHQRQDEIMLPELEKRCYYGPSQIIKMGHISVNSSKHELKDLVEHGTHRDFSQFKWKLNAIVGVLAPTTREFIFIEDNILYPVALEVIDDPSVWERVKAISDEMGYCGLCMDW